MAHAEKTVVINRPVESVFGFVLNGANNKLWRSSVLDIKPLSEMPYGVGSKFEQGLKGPTGRIAGDYEITECRPNELIQFQVTAGPARPAGLYRFQRQGSATQLTFILDSRPEARPKQMDTASARQVAQEAQGDASAVAKLSPLEKKVMGQVSEGKSNQDIARSTSLGEGTSRNVVSSILSKLMDPMIQRSMEQEVGMLEELKAFLEKHA